MQATYLQCFGQHLAHLLLAKMSGTAEHVALLSLPLAFLLPTASAGTDSTSEDLRPPPSVYGTFAMVQSQDRVWVGERPSMGAFG